MEGTLNWLTQNIDYFTVPLGVLLAFCASIMGFTSQRSRRLGVPPPLDTAGAPLEPGGRLSFVGSGLVLLSKNFDCGGELVILALDRIQERPRHINVGRNSLPFNLCSFCADISRNGHNQAVA